MYLDGKILSIERQLNDLKLEITSLQRKQEYAPEPKVMSVEQWETKQNEQTLDMEFWKCGDTLPPRNRTVLAEYRPHPGQTGVFVLMYRATTHDDENAWCWCGMIGSSRTYDKDKVLRWTPSPKPSKPPAIRDESER
jgi:hypothetical protein